MRLQDDTACLPCSRHTIPGVGARLHSTPGEASATVRDLPELTLSSTERAFDRGRPGESYRGSRSYSPRKAWPGEGCESAWNPPRLAGICLGASRSIHDRAPSRSVARLRPRNGPVGDRPRARSKHHAVDDLEVGVLVTRQGVGRTHPDFRVYAPGVQIRDTGPPLSASINSFSRLTNVAGSSSWPPSASVA